MDATIDIRGARVNNLKNISVSIPRNQFVVITGLSGSGKSSLAFDTLYAEGQRRYVESLSAYARQFLGRMNKPEVDFIKGIPPAIAIEQKVNTRNPRSTVGTSTEIYEYLRSCRPNSKTLSPVSGEEVKKHTVEDVINHLLSYPTDTRFYILCPLVVPAGRTLAVQLDMLLKQGFSRVEVGDELVQIETLLQRDSLQADSSKADVSQPDRERPLPDASSIRLLIDRMMVNPDPSNRSRMADSIETAFYEGDNVCQIRVFTEEASSLVQFSKSFEADGMTFDEPTDQLFSFNSPAGACPTCEGFGKVIGIDEDLVVPNKSLSIYDDAIYCWRGEKMSAWKDELIKNASTFDFPFRPWYQLSDEQRQLVWTGNAYFQFDASFRMLEGNHTRFSTG